MTNDMENKRIDDLYRFQEQMQKDFKKSYADLTADMKTMTAQVTKMSEGIAVMVNTLEFYQKDLDYIKRNQQEQDLHIKKIREQVNNHNAALNEIGDIKQVSDNHARYIEDQQKKEEATNERRDKIRWKLFDYGLRILTPLLAGIAGAIAVKFEEFMKWLSA